MNLQAIAFLDVFDLAASLRPRLGMFGDGTPRLLTVRRRKDDEEFASAAEAKKWPELTGMLSRIKRMGEALLPGGVEFGCIHFEMLDPGAIVPWGAEAGPYAETYLRLHLPIRSNPAAMLFIGTEAHHLLPGQLSMLKSGVLVSAINLGEFSRIHLVIDVRRPDQA